MDSTVMGAPVWAFTGVPGAGKTTLVDALVERTGRIAVRSHDLVLAGDPGAISEGRLADRDVMQRAFAAHMAGLDGPVILDGWPRTEDQMVPLPDHTLVFRLWCARDIAIERLVRRGRPDDTPELAAKRWDEQEQVLRGEWLREATTHSRMLNTTNRRPDHVLDTVWLYLTGRRRDIY